MAKIPSFFGIDIGNHSIRVVELENITRKPTLVTFGSAPTPSGVIGSENEEHRRALANAIKALAKETHVNTSNVVAALPETSVFSRLLKFPKLDEKKLEEAIYWQAKQDLPVPVDEVRISWTVIGESFAQDGSQQWDVLRVAAPIILVNQYVEILKLANLNPIALETEAIAMVRAMNYIQDEASTILFDFGSNSVEVAIMKKGNLLFSQTIAIGSDMLTKAIAQDFSLETAQAEEYKRSYGLDASQLEGKIATSIKPILDSMVFELKRTIDYFTVNAPDSAPNKIVLLGEGTFLPGFVEFMAENMQVEVQIGNPWSKISVNPDAKVEFPKFSQGYAVAVGLALKSS